MQELKERQNMDWSAQHTLTQQELKQLIKEKLERAKWLYHVKENRECNKFA
jgi:hypothetical protein